MPTSRSCTPARTPQPHPPPGVARSPSQAEPAVEEPMVEGLLAPLVPCCPPLTKSVTQLCPTLCDSMDYYRPWHSPGQNTGGGSLSLLQGTFLTQGSNPGLPHCRWILYQLSHKGSPRILEWVAYPFSSPPLTSGSQLLPVWRCPRGRLPASLS